MGMAGLIDPTLASRYPIVLGETLLSGAADVLFTGIRYNHKPDLSSGDAPDEARLKPSLRGQTDSYDLSFTDDGDNYGYTGSRDTSSSQYVLHFHPARQVFILDKIDSTFSMNISRMPDNSDAERLRSEYPHLESQPGLNKQATAKKTALTKDTASQSSQSQTKESNHSPGNQQQQPAKEASLSFPEPEKQKPSKSKAHFEDEEDDDDDDDGGLLIEYPGGDTAKHADFSPAFPPPRRFDDFMDQRESEGDDADAEGDDEPDMDFKLPSPVNNHVLPPVSTEPMVEAQDEYEYEYEDEDEEEGEVEGEGEGEAEADGLNDMEADLEKDMEMAFEDIKNSPDADESEISEED
ncbi:hypothetical protein E4U23_006370 [Claviceps purpurea]|nr:hypothetical protein E4U26_001388 [Claviceps purpurea]KAG6243978.1 hypothetical protein E4U23_006370 [Claviceps purpurea]